MQKPQQSQPTNPSGVSDLMEDEVRVCDTCGDAGREELLALCSKCSDGAEHIYCMRAKLDKVPEGDWICEECRLRADTEKSVQAKVEEAARISKGRLNCQKSGSSLNFESRSSLKLKLKSSCAGGSGPNAVSSTSQLSVKRNGAPLEAQSAKIAGDSGMIAVAPRSSKLCKNLEKGKVKAAKGITSVLQFSHSSQEKAKVSHNGGKKIKSDASTSEAESDKKKRALETRSMSSKVSKPSTHSLLSRDPSFKNLEKAKLEAAHNVNSEKQSLYGTDAKAVLPSLSGEKSAKFSLQPEISLDKRSLLKSGSSNASDLKSKGQLAKSDCLQKQKAARNLAFHDNRKGKDLRVVSKSLSFNSVGTDKLNAAGSEVLMANASGPETLKRLSHAKEAKTAKGNATSELNKPAMCSTASVSGVPSIQSEKETMSCDETLFSKSFSHKLDAIQNCQQSDYRLKPSSNITHKDLYHPNEEMKNQSQQVEWPTQVSSAMQSHNLFTGVASDQRSYLRSLPQFDASILFQDSVIPKPHYTWQGKFQICSGSGRASFCDRIQAHLSIFVSPKVIEVAEKLPEIIMLEKSPRSRMWPSQFVERGATEEDIGLYFFAEDCNSYRRYYQGLLEYMTQEDLALNGNIDGVELLIFSSSVLPEDCQYWNGMLYLWGVFRGRKVDNSVNIPVSNSQKEQNRDNGISAFDLNALPQEGESIARADGVNRWSTKSSIEVHNLDSTDNSFSADRILLEEYNYSSSVSEPRPALNKGGENNSGIPDLNLSLWPASATPKDGLSVSVGIADNKTNKKVHGKQLMGDINDSDNGKPSGSGSHSFSLASPALTLENLDPNERLALEGLLSLPESISDWEV